VHNLNPVFVNETIASVYESAKPVFEAVTSVYVMTGYAVGQQLVIRATEEVFTGQEVTLNWLGSLLTAPLTQRRSELREKYGFLCECRR
jgi:hypothetical protein